MADAAVISRPKLTMPEAEAAFLSAAYDAAGAILEYGAGGSTVMAAEIAGTSVWAVESDKKFLRGVQAYLDANPPKAEVHLHHANIGPTSKWARRRMTASGGAGSHIRLGFGTWTVLRSPDVVLIDGRFRAACFLAVAFRTRAPVEVYWDDYVEREKYHEVERLAKPIEIVGRMARFEVEPMRPEGTDLAWIMDVFGRKQ